MSHACPLLPQFADADRIRQAVAPATSRSDEGDEAPLFAQEDAP